MLATNHLYDKSGNLFGVYEGAYLIENNRFIYFLSGPKGETHRGTAELKNDALVLRATIYPGKSIKSYKSEMLSNNGLLYYYAHCSKDMEFPEEIDHSSALIYYRLTKTSAETEVHVWSNKMETTSDKIILSQVIVNCSIDTAFNYFAENKLLTMWLTIKADVEMKVGGKYELFWSPEDPDPSNNSTYGCRVLAVDKPYLFNIEWTGNIEQKEFMNATRPLTNVTFIFSEIDEQKTKISLIHSGWRRGEEWEKARLWFENAWKVALDKLKVLVDNNNRTGSKI